MDDGPASTAERALEQVRRECIRTMGNLPRRLTTERHRQVNAQHVAARPILDVKVIDIVDVKVKGLNRFE